MGDPTQRRQVVLVWGAEADTGVVLTYYSVFTVTDGMAQNVDARARDPLQSLPRTRRSGAFAGTSALAL